MRTISTARGARRALRRAALFGLAATGLLTGLPTVAAAPDPPRPTRLELRPLGVHALGDGIDLKVRLTNMEGEAQGNKVLEIFLGDLPLRRARTEADGVASFRIRDVPVGSYTVRADFIGTRDYLPSSAATGLTVRPAVLTLVTVPPVAGVPFTFGDRRIVSDASGTARLEVAALGAYRLAAALEPETRLGPRTRVSFLRWADSVFDPVRVLEIGGDVQLEAGLALSHPVQTRFFDLGGEPVPWARVAELRLKGSNGSHRTLTDGKPHWLQANRVQRLRSGMVVAPLQYSVESVTLDGANVVNRYQQRFSVDLTNLWRVELLLYSATIRAHDALFGFPVGSGVALTYPDGRTETFPFGPDDAVRVGPLARGVYTLQIVGATGVAPPTPVALSRDQEVELKALSALDIGAGAATGLFLALGLLFYGRPQLLGLGRRGGSPRPPAQPAPPGAYPARQREERL